MKKWQLRLQPYTSLTYSNMDQWTLDITMFASDKTTTSKFQHVGSSRNRFEVEIVKKVQKLIEIKLNSSNHHHFKVTTSPTVNNPKQVGKVLAHNNHYTQVHPTSLQQMQQAWPSSHSHKDDTWILWPLQVYIDKTHSVADIFSGLQIEGVDFQSCQWDKLEIKVRSTSKQQILTYNGTVLERYLFGD